MIEAKRKCLTVQELINRLEEYADKSELVICKCEDGGEYAICDIDENGYMSDLDDEDSFQNSCFLYGYIDP